MNALGHAVQISRRAVELLAFPLVFVGPDNPIVGTGESRVNVEQSLNIVVACRKLSHRSVGIAEAESVNHCSLARLKLGHIFAEKLRLRAPRTNLKPGFRIVHFGDHDKNPSRNRLFVASRQCNFESRDGGSSLGGGLTRKGDYLEEDKNVKRTDELPG